MERRIERIDKYLKNKGISANYLEKESGLSKGTLSKARSGKTDIGASNIVRVLEKFTDLNETWLLTGEGEMLKPPAANVVENTNNSGSITQTTTTAAPSPSSAALDRALSEIAEQRKLVADSHALTAASQAQVDRLLAIIENMTSRK